MAPIRPFGEVTDNNVMEILRSKYISLEEATSDELFKLANAKKERETSTYSKIFLHKSKKELPKPL
jgi:hypothetical protein